MRWLREPLLQLGTCDSPWNNNFSVQIISLDCNLVYTRSSRMCVSGITLMSYMLSFLVSGSLVPNKARRVIWDMRDKPGFLRKYGISESFPFCLRGKQSQSMMLWQAHWRVELLQSMFHLRWSVALYTIQRSANHITGCAIWDCGTV